MVRSFALSLFLLSSAAFAQADASVTITVGPSVIVFHDAGVMDAGAPVVVAPTSNPIVLPPPTVALPDSDPSLGWAMVTAQEIKSAVTSKAWGQLIFLVITALVIVVRKVLAPKFTALQGKLTPTILAFLFAGAGALATTWTAGAKLTTMDLFLSLQAGIMGAGGFHIIEAVLKHFSPVDPTQKNWASTLDSWLISLEPVIEKALPATPKPPSV